MHSWVVKLVFYLNKSARSIFFTIVRLLGRTRAKKEQKIGPNGGPKHKIAYYGGKMNVKVPKMHSWVVKLVFYLNKSARSIFFTIVRL